jgi:tetratricopeptide (TPR) repeat protein
MIFSGRVQDDEQNTFPSWALGFALFFVFFALPVAAAEDPNLDQLGRAEALLSKKLPSEALKIVNAFLVASPGDPKIPKALLIKGSSLMAEGKEQEALEAWAALLSRFATAPEVPAALANSIDIYTSSKGRKNPVMAQQLTKQLTQTFPTNPAAYRFVLAQADAFLTKKQYAEAARVLTSLGESLKPLDKERLHFAQILASGLKDVEFLSKQAGRSFETDDVGTAIRLYETALEAFPTSTRTYELKTKLGWCLFTRGAVKDHEKAESLWRQVASLKSRDEWVGEARWHLVQLLSGPKHKWPEAAEMCSEIAKDFAGTVRQEQALYTRAWLFWSAHDYAKAVPAFQDLVTAFPETAKHPPILYYISDSEQKVRAQKTTR